MRTDYGEDSAKLRSALERALEVIQAAAQTPLLGDDRTPGRDKRRHAPGLGGRVTAPALPEFSARVGVSCAEWRMHVFSAATFGQPKVWDECRREVEGLSCVVKHSLSPFGTGSALGAIQFFPLAFRGKPDDDVFGRIRELPTGIYVFERDFNLCHKIIPLKHLLYPFLRVTSWVHEHHEHHKGLT